MFAGDNLPNVRKAMKHMLKEQGDLGIDTSKIELSNDFDWHRLERALLTLTDAEIELLAVGEEEEMATIKDQLEDGDYAHEAMDELFMLIGG